MPPGNTGPDHRKLAESLAAIRHQREQQEKTYRERALKLLPWVCARCGREFGGRRLRELTVHHRDHNHDNNPPDGSNWELLCLFCHENEHARDLVAEYSSGDLREERGPAATHRPFAGLDALLKDRK